MKTREEIEAMTDEERRIATAQICWPQFPIFKRGRELRHQYNHRDGPVYNYPLDLNAMIEATQRLDAAHHGLYRQCLADMITADAGGTAEDYARAMLDATARQRNTALLMVMME